MVNAAVNGELDDVPTEVDPVFGVGIPTSVPDVPQEVLRPRDTWADKAAYDEKASELAGLFHKNFAQFADKVKPEVLAAGPLVGR
jgi:phosphoenolpyruvate carboxykinase (ATP)